jgi:hypothetical protein
MSSRIESANMPFGTLVTTALINNRRAPGTPRKARYPETTPHHTSRRRPSRERVGGMRAARQRVGTGVIDRSRDWARPSNARGSRHDWHTANVSRAPVLSLPTSARPERVSAIGGVAVRPG